MLTSDDILSRRTSYACCALDYLDRHAQAHIYGDKKCADTNWRLFIYLKLAQRTMCTAGDGGCTSLSVASAIADVADCLCDTCGCPDPDNPQGPYPPSCEIVPDYTVIAAVDAVLQLEIELAGPEVGDAYLVAWDTGGTGEWLVNTIVTWNGTGWDSVALLNGQIVVDEGGAYWTTLGFNTPGLLYPGIDIVLISAPSQYTVQSVAPQIALFSGRTVMVEGLTPSGWVVMYQGPEFNIAAPFPVNLNGISFTYVRASYIDANGCIGTQTGNGEVVGCPEDRDHDCLDHDLQDHS
jgi:hypothetical protein